MNGSRKMTLPDSERFETDERRIADNKEDGILWCEWEGQDGDQHQSDSHDHHVRLGKFNNSLPQPWLFITLVVQWLMKW